MFRRCFFFEQSQVHFNKYCQQYVDFHGRTPDAETKTLIADTADRTALRQLGWARQESKSKLLPIQQQDYNVPHPADYICAQWRQQSSRNGLPIAYLVRRFPARIVMAPAMPAAITSSAAAMRLLCWDRCTVRCNMLDFSRSPTTPLMQWR
jgi:hypothetical protein